MMAAFPDHAGLHSLVAAATAIRTRANARAQEAMAGSRYQRLLLTLGLWLQRKPWLKMRDPTLSPSFDTGAARFAADVLRRRSKKVLRLGEALMAQSDEQRHAVRIALKKLRYATEFFASLDAERHSGAGIDLLSDLQDDLGAMNDAATTLQLLAQLEPRPDPQWTEALGIVRGWTLGAAGVRLALLEPAWLRFQHGKKLWRNP
jgi:CHAD domain-containing protein